MDEQNPAARVVEPSTVAGATPLPRAPFDPADLLSGRRPPPLPYVAGPTVEVAREFDPAAYLGKRALRGAFNLATVKPLVTTIGGVEARVELPPEPAEEPTISEAHGAALGTGEEREAHAAALDAAKPTRRSRR